MSKNLSENIKKLIKKEYIKSKLKSIIAENVKLLIETKMRIIHDKFEELFKNKEITEDEYKSVFKFDKDNNFKGPKGTFRYPIFAEMVYKTVVNKENHSFQEMIDSFPMFEQKILDVYNKKLLKNPRIPGTSNEVYPIVDLIDKKELTFSKYLEYLDLLNRTDARTETLQLVLDEGFKKNNQNNKNFEIIYNEKDWIVVYPKTYLGSIAVARMGPDYNYYTPPDTIGKINWCTSVDSPGNMFLNYSVHMNLHMYYFIKKSGFNSSESIYHESNKGFLENFVLDSNRKVCISIRKANNQVGLAFGTASVNANNDAFKDEQECINAVGQKMIDLIIKDAKKTNRLEISLSDYYKSVSTRQYSDLRKAVNSDLDSLSHFAKEIPYYFKYNKNPEIRKLILEDSYRDIVAYTSFAIQNGDLKPTEEEANSYIIRTLYNDSLDDLRFKPAMILKTLQKCGEKIWGSTIKSILSSNSNTNAVINAVFQYCKEYNSEMISEFILRRNSQQSAIFLSQNKYATSKHIKMVLPLMSGYARSKILENEELPEDILKILCSEPSKFPWSEHFKLVSHKNMTKQTLYIFWKSWYYRLDKFPGKGKKILRHNLDNMGTYELVKEILSSKNVTSNIIDEIIRDKIIPTDDVYHEISGNHFVDPEYFDKALTAVAHLDKLRRVKSKIAENPNAKPETLQSLFKSIQEERGKKSLAGARTHDIVISFAKNPNTPKNILEVISKVNSSKVREELCKNPSAPRSFLIKMIKGWKKEYSERTNLYAIYNPSAPIEYLLYYIGSDGPYYQKAVQNVMKREGITVADQHDAFYELCQKLGYRPEKILKL